jgi:hypothetical protein
MATPATYSNRAQEAEVLGDEKLVQAYEEGHDADGSITKESAANVDIEKGLQSNVGSTHSDDRTLGEDAPEPTRGGEGNTDPDLVDWDGPDDPENPQNWTTKRKWTLIGALSAVTLIT